jgi:hypothetical protein
MVVEYGVEDDDNDNNNNNTANGYGGAEKRGATFTFSLPLSRKQLHVE